MMVWYCRTSEFFGSRRISISAPLSSSLERGHHRQAADELRDQAELDEVFGMDLREQLAGLLLFLARRSSAPKPIDVCDRRRSITSSRPTNAPPQMKRMFVVSIWMNSWCGCLRPPCGGTLATVPSRIFSSACCTPSPRDVAGDRGVVALAADLVDLVDVDDAALRLLLVVAGGLVELEDDVLDVLADVAGLGERGGVDDREGHREHAGQRLREQRLAGAGGADQQDVRLLQLDVLARVARLVVDPLVVVVDRDGQLLLGPLLADDVQVEELFDLFRLRKLTGALQSCPARPCGPRR